MLKFKTDSMREGDSIRYEFQKKLGETRTLLYQLRNIEHLKRQFRDQLDKLPE